MGDENMSDNKQGTGIDRRGALEEYHRAFELAPDDSTIGASYAAILKKLSQP